MKYWYDSNTIDKSVAFYKIIDDTILVYYLNGNVDIIQYSEEIVNELIQKMICQAKERDKTISIEDLKSVNNLNNKKLFNEISVSCSGLLVSNIQNLNHSVRLLGVIVSITCSLLALKKARVRNAVNRQIEELEKYKLYLSMMKEIEDNYNQKTFNGIKFFDGNFNINTLDNYSLNEVKKIKKNLEKNK